MLSQLTERPLLPAFMHFSSSGFSLLHCIYSQTLRITVLHNIFPNIHITYCLWQMSTDSVALVMLLPTMFGSIWLHLLNSNVMSLLVPSYGRQEEANETYQS